MVGEWKRCLSNSRVEYLATINCVVRRAKHDHSDCKIGQLWTCLYSWSQSDHGKSKVLLQTEERDRSLPMIFLDYFPIQLSFITSNEWVYCNLNLLWYVTNNHTLWRQSSSNLDERRQHNENWIHHIKILTAIETILRYSVEVRELRIGCGGK